jgi:hypothetical protein
MTYEITKETKQWAKIVGEQLVKDVAYEYGNGWRHFGVRLRADIIEGRILGIMLNVERFSRGDMADGEFEARARVVRDYVTAKINPENA